MGYSGILDNFIFMLETWKLNASFNHLIGRFYNDAGIIRQLGEVNNKKVNRARAEAELIRKLVFLFKEKWKSQIF